MAIDAPTHGELAVLVGNFHFLNRTVAGLAVHFTCIDVLCVVEVGQVWKVVNPYPLNGLLLVSLHVDALLRVPSDGCIDFLNFWAALSAVLQVARSVYHLRTVNVHVAVHTNVCSRNSGVLAVARAAVAVVAVHPVFTCVNLMAERDRLNGLVVFLNANAH